MTEPELLLALARHKYPCIKIEVAGDGFMAFDGEIGRWDMQWRFIGPIWERHKAAVIERLVEKGMAHLGFKIDETAGKIGREELVLYWYSRATLKDIAIALVSHWYPDGIDI